MFGYIRFDRNELKIKEYHLLRAYYCGLCHALGKAAPILKLKLSYDMTFLALCVACASDENPVLKKKLCLIHPTKKTLYAISSSIDLAAQLSVLLAVFKLRDDVTDGEKLRGFIGTGILKQAYKKTKHRHPELHDALEQKLLQFYETEKTQTDAEELAVSFGEVLKGLIPHLCIPEKYIPVIEQIAVNLAQWIYIADAADDLEADRKKGRFNPLKEPTADYAPGQSYRLSQAKNAAALLPDNQFNPIIENFLTFGMYHQQIKYFSKEDHHGN